MSATLAEKIYRYEPSTEEIRSVLSLGTVLEQRIAREERMLELIVSFDRLIPKDLLYRIETEAAAVYDLRSFRILPHYPAELLSQEYLYEILKETERIGIVARGFFRDASPALSGDTVTVTIPFSVTGVDLLSSAGTADVISSIIRSEFGLEIKTVICEDEAGMRLFEEDRRHRFDEIDRKLTAADKAYEQRKSVAFGGNPSDKQEEDKPKFPRLETMFPYNPADVTLEDPAHYKVGVRTFDLTQKNTIYGNDFDLIPVPILSVKKPIRNVTFVGELFSLEQEEMRGKINCSFGIFDGVASITVHKYGLEEDDAKAFMKTFKGVTALAVHGYTKEDKSGELYLNITDAATVVSVPRMDNAPKKRVELHLHTNMSAMDAITPPEIAVRTAKAWGHPAVAITDHGNVQGFPEAMLESEKIGQKVIYGMEAYFVNDTATAVTGKIEGDFNRPMIVFDLETTGLSPINDTIIEIGAVKIENGKVVDTYDSFVNPKRPLSAEITELTSITDEMVSGEREIAEVMPEFLAFCGGLPMVAHNASFDTSFMRAECEKLGMPFDVPYLDTLALSRFLNTDLKNHKLDSLQKHYKLDDFHHHRACDDAAILAEIFFRMAVQMREKEIPDFPTLSKDMLEKNDPTKMQSYHMILLVKNQAGMKNLYKLISKSYLEYYYRNPRVPKTELEKLREGLIVGSACAAGELVEAILEKESDQKLKEIASFYDYLEIQPLCNNTYMLEDGKRMMTMEDLKNINRTIVRLGEELGKPVCATCDAHFLNPEDEIYRKILLAGMKFGNPDRDTHIYYRTTDEMLAEFDYLGKEKAYEVVVENTNLIADMVEPCRPIPKGTYTPHLDGAEEELQEKCWTRAKKMYGDPLPTIVSERLNKELTSIIEHGFAVLYVIAERLVHKSEELGFLVGSRGSVGSSFVAHMSGISEVNPLPPHYYCPHCQYSDFSNPDKAGSGFDMPDMDCPKCGTRMLSDGQDIPFETFLGFYGDKSPDIDLNFSSGELQGKIHKYTEELFGHDHVFRAGTLGTLADKTAYGYVMKYFEDRQKSLTKAETERVISCLVGVKRTTGQHPGGIIVVPKEFEVYDFTPIQHPADDPDADTVTTHFAFSYLHDTILKLDELGHDVPTKYKWMEKFSDTSVMDVKMNDPTVYALFHSTDPLGVTPDDIGAPIGTLGLPEFGTRFIMQVLVDAKPKNFADLMQISGLTHGTNVWLGNAQDIIKAGKADISHVIGTRDGIMLDLIRYGVEKGLAFKIMESVRKGKGLTPEWEEAMNAAGLPDWYIPSCKKIKYMFPKAHAAAYVMSAIRLGWYKVHIPLAFYGAMFTVAPGDFDAELVSMGRSAVMATIKDIEKRGKEASQKEQASVPTLQLANECMARGIKFLSVDIEKSDASAFLPENGHLRMPFCSLGGLGVNAAAGIVAAREKEPFFSVEDLQIRAGLNKSVIDILRRNHVLDSLNETDQLTLF